MYESAIGSIARRVLAWIVLIVIALITLKVLVGIVVGFVATTLSLVVLALLVVGAVWALRRV